MIMASWITTRSNFVFVEIFKHFILYLNSYFSLYHYSPLSMQKIMPI